MLRRQERARDRQGIVLEAVTAQTETSLPRSLVATGSRVSLGLTDGGRATGDAAAMRSACRDDVPPRLPDGSEMWRLLSSSLTLIRTYGRLTW